MKLEEAIKVNGKAKLVDVNGYVTFNEVGILVDENGTRLPFYKNFLESDWEVVDNWNLADEIKKYSSFGIGIAYINVKKARDLIIEDFEKQRPITDFKVTEILNIINKRFGDFK